MKEIQKNRNVLASIFVIVYLFIRLLVLLIYFFPVPDAPTFQFYDAPFAIFEMVICLVFITKGIFELKNRWMRWIFVFFFMKNVLVSIWLFFLIFVYIFIGFMYSKNNFSIEMLFRSIEAVISSFPFALYNVPLLYIISKYLKLPKGKWLR